MINTNSSFCLLSSFQFGDLNYSKVITSGDTSQTSVFSDLTEITNKRTLGRPVHRRFKNVIRNFIFPSKLSNYEHVLFAQRKNALKNYQNIMLECNPDSLLEMEWHGLAQTIEDDILNATLGRISRQILKPKRESSRPRQDETQCITYILWPLNGTGPTMKEKANSG